MNLVTLIPRQSIPDSRIVVTHPGMNTTELHARRMSIAIAETHRYTCNNPRADDALQELTNLDTEDP